MMNRRSLLGATASLVTTSMVPPAMARPAAHRWRGHIIDGLGVPGSVMGASGNEANISAAEMADIRASGLTAVNVTVGPVGNEPGPLYDQLIKDIGWYSRQIERNSDTLLSVRRAADLDAARASSRTGIIFGLQDTAAIGVELDRVLVLHDLGVRIVQLTYNRRNLVGDGCLELNEGGLSSFGLDMIKELGRQGMLVDLSHAGRRTVLDAGRQMKQSGTPFVISHTGCAALADRPRNSTDEGMRAVAETGGVVGIYFMPFLRIEGQPSSADVVRHIEHAINVCGEDHVGIGTDQTISHVELTPEFREQHRRRVEDRRAKGIAAPGEDEAVYYLVSDYNAPSRLLKLADDLLRRGHSRSRIEKILGGNFVRVFTQIWGS